MLHVFQTLTEYILQQPAPCFLLKEVVKHLEGKRSEGMQISICDYEFYLKNHSNLSKEKQMEIRQKIMGRKAPKEASQILFPVAANGQMPGSVVVTAHLSPDIDTVVSSFNGWMDAFEMDVSQNLHHWNVPNAPEEILEVKLLFLKTYGPSFFQVLADNRSELTLVALDLATTEGLKIHSLEDKTLDVSSESSKHACCVVDKEGNFCGGWLPEDVEKVRLVTDSLNHCIRWAQNAFFQALVSKEGDVKRLLNSRFKELEPVQEFALKRKNYLHTFLEKVLDVEQGLESSILHFMQKMDRTYSFGFDRFHAAVEQHKKGEIGDLEQIFNLLSDAFRKLRSHIDTFSIALMVKEKVYEEKKSSVHPRTTIEEINLRIQDRSAIFVTRDNKVEGVIYSSRLRNPTQGFVVLRDFSNPNEIGIPRYMEIAAIIDHHKTDVKTQKVATIYTMDVQSSNVIGAKLAFDINKKLVTDGPTEEQLNTALLEGAKNVSDNRQLRILERVLEERIARAMQIGWCDSKREAADYQMFLYAILDDTDLLAKKTALDHEIVVELVNRLVSLEQNKITEVVDPTQLKPLIQNSELYRFYKTVYSLKEEDVEQRLQSLKIFNDTKKQGEALVSQLKVYPNNIKTLKKNYDAVAKTWYEHKTEQSLKIMMLTTVEGAEDLYKGLKSNQNHKDEIWISATTSDEGVTQLSYFLMMFLQMHAKKRIEAFVPKEYKTLFDEIAGSKSTASLSEKPWIVLSFEAGSITSRKKDIAPCLK
jgi:inorganic pyrophosphatase/exopolyphosphatase